jgi:hypothetical protein
MEWSGFALLILVGVGIISTGLPAAFVLIAVASLGAGLGLRLIATFSMPVPCVCAEDARRFSAQWAEKYRIWDAETHRLRQEARKRQAFSRHPSKDLQRPDWLAEDAVGFEPVSKLKFPNNREKYRENRKIGPRNEDEIIDKASIHAGF